MDIRKLQRTIVDALEDVKAQDVQVFNTEALTSLFDRVIIASGNSNRQTRALAASVRDKVREAGGVVKNPEGAESGEWVLVDCGDAVVHIMQPAIRAYYKLEDIWGGKGVHLKARQPTAPQGADKPTARKVARPAGASAAAKKAAPAGKARTAAKKTTPSAKATSAGTSRPVARKTAPAGTTTRGPDAPPRRARRAAAD